MVSNLKTYPEYKPSGIDWLGEIPSHWICLKTQYIFSLTSGETISSEEFAKEGMFPVYGGNGVRGYHDQYNLEGEHILIGRVGALCGNIHITPNKSWVSEHALIVSPLKQFNIHWLAALLESMDLGQYSMASAQPVIAAGNVGRIYIPMPPLDEQENIAAYLDDVTGKVDALIAEKQKQVEDLRAYRTSLITETVTRGLNPDALLRPSGINWLGDIPEHWQIVKIKYVSELYSGSNITSEEIKSDGFPVFGGNGLRGYFENYNHDGDFVLIGRQGALCGNINYAHGKFWATEHAVVCHPLMDYNWFWFGELLRIMNLNQYSLASAQPGLSVERIKELQIPLPPLSEQQAMAEFLDERTAKIDALIDELNKQLAELAEYKKAVISEAVTGKVDVREWKTKN